MSLVDLHIHTTASDGRLGPTDAVALAARRGVRVMAITDHDTVDGVLPALRAAQSFPSLRVISGVEMSTDVSQGEVHVLGYFVDYRNPELLAVLTDLTNSREARAQRMVTKLADMGLHVKWEHIRKLAGGGSIGPPHIAQAMFEEGLVSSFREAFDKYIGRNCPAYAEREKMTPVMVGKLLTRVGALPVLAHPADIDDLDAMVIQLKGVGLVGMEAYYGNYPPDVMERLVAVADKHGLIPSGGSDFHGFSTADVGVELGSVDVPVGSAERLIALAGKRADATVALWTG